MACRKSGAKLPEGVDFCGKCEGGTDNSQRGEEVLELPHISLPAAGKRDAKTPPIAAVCILGMVLACAVFFVMSGGRGKQEADGESGSGAADRGAETISFPGDKPLRKSEDGSSLSATETAPGEEIPGTGIPEYVVHINICIEGDRSGTDGNADEELLSGAVVILREGTDVREGEAFRTLQAQEGGRISTSLPAGIYTAQIDVPGCERAFQQIRVEEGETSTDSYVKWQKRLVRADYYPGNLDSDVWTLVASHEYAYDNRGNLVKEYCHGMGVKVEEWMGEEMTEWTVEHCDLRESYEYDDQGRLSKTVKYSSDGSIESWIETSYDSQGNEIKQAHYGSDGSMTYWTESGYDSRGNEVRRVSYNSDGSISWQEEISYTYDSQGNEIKVVGPYSDCWTEKTYDSQGNLTMRAEYGPYYPDACLEEYYDSEGRVVRSVSPEDHHDEWVEDISYEYDDQGNLTQWTRTSYQGYEYDQENYCYVKLPSPEGMYTYYTEYRNEYDGWGNLVKSSAYQNGTDLRQWRENTYDDEGNLVREAVYSVGFYDGTWRCTMEKIYDEQGNIVEETEYDDYKWPQMGYGWDVDSMKIKYIYE